MIQKNSSVTLGEIQSELKEAGIYVGKGIISRALKRAGLFFSKSPRKVPLLKRQHLKASWNYEKKTYGE